MSDFNQWLMPGEKDDPADDAIADDVDSSESSDGYDSGDDDSADSSYDNAD